MIDVSISDLTNFTMQYKFLLFFQLISITGFVNFTKKVSEIKKNIFFD